MIQKASKIPAIMMTGAHKPLEAIKFVVLDPTSAAIVEGKTFIFFKAQ